LRVVATQANEVRPYGKHERARGKGRGAEDSVPYRAVEVQGRSATVCGRTKFAPEGDAKRIEKAL